MRAAGLLSPAEQLPGLSVEAKQGAFLIEQLPPGRRGEALRYLRYLLEN